MAKRSFTRNYIYSMLYEILAIAVPIITTPYISRILGAEQIGNYNFTVGIVSYFGIVAALGSPNYAKREIAFRQDNAKERSKLFWEIFIFRLICTAIVGASFLIFIGIVKENKLLYEIQTITVIAWIADISWLFQGMEDFKIITVRNTIVKVISTVLIFLLIKERNDLWLYTVIVCSATLIGNISCWFSAKQYLTKIKVKELKPFRHLKGILILFAAVVAVQLYTVLDQTMLGIISGPLQVGYYSQAQKIIHLLLTIIAAFSTVLLPRVASLYSQNNKFEMNRYYQLSVKYIFILAMPMMVGCIICADVFVPVFFGDGYTPVILLMRLLSPLFIILGLGQLCGTLLTAINLQIKSTIAVSIGALVNLTLNALLISHFEAVGAVIASLIAETVVTTIEMVILLKIFSLKKFAKSIYKMLIATFVMGISIYLIRFIGMGQITLLALQIVGGVSIYLSILIVLKEKIVYEVLNRMKHIIKRKQTRD